MSVPPPVGVGFLGVWIGSQVGPVVQDSLHCVLQCRHGYRLLSTRHRRDQVLVGTTAGVLRAVGFFCKLRERVCLFDVYWWLTPRMLSRAWMVQLIYDLGELGGSGVETNMLANM